MSDVERPRPDPQAGSSVTERPQLATERLAYELCGATIPRPDELARAFQKALIAHVARYGSKANA